MLGMLQSHGVAKLQIRLKDWTTNSEADLVPSGLTVRFSRSLLWLRKVPTGRWPSSLLALCKADQNHSGHLSLPHTLASKGWDQTGWAVWEEGFVSTCPTLLFLLSSPLSLPSTFPCKSGWCLPTKSHYWPIPLFNMSCNIRHRQPMGWGQGWLRRWEGSINSSIWMIRKWKLFLCPWEWVSLPTWHSGTRSGF